ncbi:MAG: hypothetical protein AAF471_08070 [Myxococcota bacterium]
MKHDLVLVTLSREQIAKAKEVNGRRKRITHALVCAPYGQIFGTEKHCLRYYASWVKNFPLLFAKGVKTDKYEISDFNYTFNLVIKLIKTHDKMHMKKYGSLVRIF